MHSYRGMSPRTALLMALVDTLRRKPVADMDLEEIVQARAVVHPHKAPYTWLLGRVAADVDISTTAAPARDGHCLTMRLYRPRGVESGPLPAVVWFHGGGWVLGNVENYDVICSAMASEVRAVVISVDYRLAPEHPFPTPLDDCVEAVDWVMGAGEREGWDASRVAVAGDSAGGNLATVVAQIRRDQGGTPLRAQALIYPATDMTMSSPSVGEHSNAAILTKPDMDAFRDHYCPEGVDETDPRVSPLFGRLGGLPPTLVQTAELDPIRDDGIRYAEALRQSRVEVSLTNYRGVPHGFASMPGVTRHARRQRAELHDFLRRHLA